MDDRKTWLVYYKMKVSSFHSFESALRKLNIIEDIENGTFISPFEFDLT